MTDEKDFSWKELMEVHPLVHNIDPDDRRNLIGELLYGGLGKEEAYAAGQVIIREGEIDDSVYLLGAGSVRVVMLGEDGNEKITLYTFQKGDTFGEMALFDSKARSATVIANTDCMVLKFHGEPFLQIVRRYPMLEFNIITRLSERLRHTDKHVLSVHTKNIDEKLEHFNTKLNAELKVIEASLKASQAVFEQTKLRTDEVISSAERSRSRLTFAASAVGIIISLFGFLGFKELMNVQDLSKALQEEIKKVESTSKEVEHLQQGLSKMAEKAVTLDASITQTNTFIADRVIDPNFQEALRQRNAGAANAAYDLLSNLDLPGSLLEEKRNKLLMSVWFEMIDVLGEEKAAGTGSAPLDFQPFLEIFIEDGLSPNQLLAAQFLKAINAAVSESPGFNVAIQRFTRFVEHYEGPGLTEEEIAHGELIFEHRPQNQRNRFQRLKRVTPTN